MPYITKPATESSWSGKHGQSYTLTGCLHHSSHNPSLDARCRMSSIQRDPEWPRHLAGLFIQPRTVDIPRHGFTGGFNEPEKFLVAHWFLM